jgi:hypothetical protein
MNLVINKCVTAVKVSNFSGHYLRNRSTLDIGVLGYIGIFNIRNTLPKFFTFLPGHSVYVHEELNVLYSSPNIFPVIKSRRLRCAGHIARMGDSRVVCSILVGKPEGKRPLARPRCRWENNI